MKGMIVLRSQIPLLAKGHWCIYETLRSAYEYKRNTDTHTHGHTCYSSLRTPSGKISLVFIIWFQIHASTFTVHMGEENKQQLLLFPVSCLTTSLAFFEARSHLMLMRLKKQAHSYFVSEPLSSSSLSFCLQHTRPHSHPLFSKD